MAYTRGSAEDFDRYAKVTGDWGWSWNEILPYFLKVMAVFFFLSCRAEGVLPRYLIE